MTPVGGPTHSFGGAPFDPSVPGALTVVAADGGFVIGPPGVEPPLYDPGGPSCVVDRIIGPDRASLLDAAMATAVGRGDAGMVVVSDVAEQALQDLLAVRASEPKSTFSRLRTAGPTGRRPIRQPTER